MNSSAAALGSFVFAIAFALIFLVIYIILIRRVFKINQQVKLQQQQVNLLAQIAIRHGVDPSVVSTIIERPVGN